MIRSDVISSSVTRSRTSRGSVPTLSDDLPHHGITTTCRGRADRSSSRSVGCSPQRLGSSDKRQKRGLQQTGASTGLLVGALNIQSLKPKTLELTQELHRHGYDVMLLSETWLKPATPSRLITIPGYKLIRVDRPDGRGYGGVAALVKVGVTAAPLKVCTNPSADSKLEVLWIMVKLDRGHQLVIGLLYRPPRHTVAALRADFEDLETQLQYIYINHPRASVLICGDLNCDMMKALPDVARSRLEEFLDAYSLHQIVTLPTFSSGSLLDVCIVKNPATTHDCCTEFCHFSPHKFIRFRIAVTRNRVKPFTVMSRSLKRIDINSFLDDLLYIDWGAVYRSAAVTDKWEVFLSLFLPVLNQHAPVKKITIRNPTAPPVSDTTKVLMARRRRVLGVKGRKSLEYRDLNRLVRAAIRKDTRNDIQSRILQQGATSVWRNIRSVVQSKTGGQSVVVPATTVDCLNDFFVSVGPKVANELTRQGPAPDIACRLPRVGACGLTLSPVTLRMLRQTLMDMSSTAACGSDGLCIRVFKAALPAIGRIILNIVNACITRSDIPIAWKHSIIHPIFKSGSASDPSNFRPISIIPVITKLIERLVQSQLYYYLSCNHLLSSSQHGFRPRHSTETALMTVTDRIMTATDDGEITLVCLIDLSKCFDVIDHDILLRKLQLYGVDTAWFRAYLGGHTQCVALRDRYWATKTLKSL